VAATSTHRQSCECRNLVHTGQVACRYSWMTPPRRSCRRTVRRNPVGFKGLRPSPATVPRRSTAKKINTGRYRHVITPRRSGHTAATVEDRQVVRHRLRRGSYCVASGPSLITLLPSVTPKIAAILPVARPPCEPLGPASAMKAPANARLGNLVARHPPSSQQFERPLRKPPWRTSYVQCFTPRPRASADMLVVGSRGVGGFTQLMMGSVSSQVAQHAYCPIVIIPPRAGSCGGGAGIGGGARRLPRR
jgi:hypothetical protein